jgi:hypothetical protein
MAIWFIVDRKLDVCFVEEIQGKKSETAGGCNSESYSDFELVNGHRREHKKTPLLLYV